MGAMETHTPVLVQETMKQMAIAPGNIVVDGTLGLGGHAQHLLRTMQGGVFVGIDADKNALTGGTGESHATPGRDSRTLYRGKL